MQSGQQNSSQESQTLQKKPNHVLLEEFENRSSKDKPQQNQPRQHVEGEDSNTEKKPTKADTSTFSKFIGQDEPSLNQKVQKVSQQPILQKVEFPIETKDFIQESPNQNPHSNIKKENPTEIEQIKLPKQRLNTNRPFRTQPNPKNLPEQNEDQQNQQQKRQYAFVSQPSRTGNYEESSSSEDTQQKKRQIQKQKLNQQKLPYQQPRINRTQVYSEQFEQMNNPMNNIDINFLERQQIELKKEDELREMSERCVELYDMFKEGSISNYDFFREKYQIYQRRANIEGYEPEYRTFQQYQQSQQQLYFPNQHKITEYMNKNRNDQSVQRYQRNDWNDESYSRQVQKRQERSMEQHEDRYKQKQQERSMQKRQDRSWQKGQDRGEGMGNEYLSPTQEDKKNKYAQNPSDDERSRWSSNNKNIMQYYEIPSRGYYSPFSLTEETKIPKIKYWEDEQGNICQRMIWPWMQQYQQYQKEDSMNYHSRSISYRNNQQQPFNQLVERFNQSYDRQLQSRKHKYQKNSNQSDPENSNKQQEREISNNLYQRKNGYKQEFESSPNSASNNMPIKNTQKMNNNRTLSYQRQRQNQIGNQNQGPIGGSTVPISRVIPNTQGPYVRFVRPILGQQQQEHDHNSIGFLSTAAGTSIRQALFSNGALSTAAQSQINQNSLRSDLAREGSNLYRQHNQYPFGGNQNDFPLERQQRIQNSQAIDLDNSFKTVQHHVQHNGQRNPKEVKSQMKQTNDSKPSKSRYQVGQNRFNKIMNFKKNKKVEKKQQFQYREVIFLISTDGSTIYTVDCYKYPESEENKVYYLKDNNQNNEQSRKSHQQQSPKRMQEREPEHYEQFHLVYPSEKNFFNVEIDNAHDEVEKNYLRKKVQSSLTNPLTNVKAIVYRQQKDLQVILDFLSSEEDDFHTINEENTNDEYSKKSQDFMKSINSIYNNSHDNIWSQDQIIRGVGLNSHRPHNISQQQINVPRSTSFVDKPHPILPRMNIFDEVFMMDSYKKRKQQAVNQNKQNLEQKQQKVQQNHQQKVQQNHQQKVQQNHQQKSYQSSNSSIKKVKKQTKKKILGNNVKLEDKTTTNQKIKKETNVVNKQPTGSLYRFQLIQNKKQQKLIQVRRSGRIFSKSKAKYEEEEQQSDSNQESNEKINESQSEDNRLDENNLSIDNKAKKQRSERKSEKRSNKRPNQRHQPEVTLQWLKEHLQQLDKIVVNNVFMEDDYKAMTEKDAEISKFLLSLQEADMDSSNPTKKEEEKQQFNSEIEVKRQDIRENDIMRPIKQKIEQTSRAKNNKANRTNSKQSKNSLQSKRSKASKSVRKPRTNLTKKQLAKRSNIKIHNTYNLKINTQNQQPQNDNKQRHLEQTADNYNQSLVKIQQNHQQNQNINNHNSNSIQWTKQQKIRFFNDNRRNYQVPEEFPLTIKEVVDPDILDLGVYALVRLGRLSEFSMGVQYALIPLSEIRFARIKDVKDSVEQSKRLVPKQQQNNIGLVQLNGQSLDMIRKAKQQRDLARMNRN